MAAESAGLWGSELGQVSSHLTRRLVVSFSALQAALAGGSSFGSSVKRLWMLFLEARFSSPANQPFCDFLGITLVSNLAAKPAGLYCLQLGHVMDRQTGCHPHLLWFSLSLPKSPLMPVPCYAQFLTFLQCGKRV